MDAELTYAQVKCFIGEREPTCHKGMNGRGLLLAGSPGFSGAAVMASAAALRGGIGTLKILCPGEIKHAFAVLPEAMAVTFPGGWADMKRDNLLELTNAADCIAAGPGMGKGSGVWETVKTVEESGKKTVLDADALNAASEQGTVEIFNANTVITPHIGEMARLTGLKTSEISGGMTECARFFAKKWNCTVLLKSAQSVIAEPGGEYRINRNGNSGLAKGGSGDVLTGLILAFLGQGLAPFTAACAGAYLLGASADEALLLLKERMLMARDVIGMVEHTIRETTFGGNNGH